MKIIKLDRRHNLYKKDQCAYAFKFDSWYGNIETISEIERMLTEAYGHQFSFRKKTHWKTHWGRQRYVGGFPVSSRPYWIGVKNESTVSYVMMKLDLLTET